MFISINNKLKYMHHTQKFYFYFASLFSLILKCFFSSMIFINKIDSHYDNNNKIKQLLILHNSL